MRVIVEPTPEAAAVRAASRVASLVRRRPDCVLALSSGSTPVRVYQELVRLHRESGLDFSQVRTFNLDEYVGLDRDDPRSFAAYIGKHLIRHVNLGRDRAESPDGRAPDPVAECARYEAAIAAAGGLDLALLGIGADGHIAFNEPGSSLRSRTRVKTLARKTLRANAPGFGDAADVPRLALTMGIGTLLDARACVLLAFGAEKAQAVQAAVEGPVTAQVPASALQLHPEVSVVLDEAAASDLARLDYYRETEVAQRALEAALAGGR